MNKSCYSRVRDQYRSHIRESNRSEPGNRIRLKYQADRMHDDKKDQNP